MGLTDHIGKLFGTPFASKDLVRHENLSAQQLKIISENGRAGLVMLITMMFITTDVVLLRVDLDFLAAFFAS
jgi:hypothetical protein